MARRMLVLLLINAITALGSPAASPSCTLENSLVRAAFTARGLATLELLKVPASGISMINDEFALRLDASSTFVSSDLPTPEVAVSNKSHCILNFIAKTHELKVMVLYQLRPSTAFVSKVLKLTHTGAGGAMRNLTECAPIYNARFAAGGGPPNQSTVVRSHYGLHDYAAFVRWPAPRSLGVLLTAQNPYLHINSSVASTSVAYTAGLAWRTRAPLLVDAGIVGLHTLSGILLPPPADPIDEAEHGAMVAALKAYLVAPGRDDETVKINIGWTENDYQLDISRAEDRAAYKRIIDRAAQFGISHVLFAPRNSDVSCKRNNTDAWGWEQILWFGMGQKLRLGEWTPGDPLPASLTEMLAHFQLRNVKPVAYIYPILAFLRGTYVNGTSPPWIVPGTYALRHTDGARPPLPLGGGEEEDDDDGGAHPPDGGGHEQPPAPTANGPWRACLASPELQEWLPQTMLAFAKQTGAGGFSFDYTYFEQHGNFPTFYASQYAQWAGWRRILAALHADPHACAGGTRCVVDNRQRNHQWGPWMWVQGGTYAEPLMSDEQPGSWMFYEADLHTDRLSANRQRQVAWSYRVQEFCPNEVLPGFAFHQTDRAVTPVQAVACPDGRCSNASRARDFDLLGYRYSLLSSIGTAGLNNVLCYLPARDAEEFAKLPKEDIAYVRGWLAWADAHVPLLRTAFALPRTSVPSYGVLDGVAMISASNRSGIIFIFNPSSHALTYEVPFNASLRLPCSPGGVVSSPGLLQQHLLVTQVDSSERTFPGPTHLAVVRCGDALNVTVPPTTAIVLRFETWKEAWTDEEDDEKDGTVVLLLGARAAAARLRDGPAMQKHIVLSGVAGEVGTHASILVAVPSSSVPRLGAVHLNGKPVPFTKEDGGGPAGRMSAVRIRGVWGATPRFERNAQLCAGSAPTASGAWGCTVHVPSWVFEQLHARNASFPLHYDLRPNSTDDADTAWLAPGRLLIWLKYRNLLDDSLNISGTLDGTTTIPWRRAYNTIVPSSRRFIGHFADVTHLLTPDANHTLQLQLPATSSSGPLWSMRKGAIAAGGDLAQMADTTVAAAEAACAAHSECAGLTFRRPVWIGTCDDVYSSAAKVTAYLKLSASGNTDPEWCTAVAPPKFVGVFFENVETGYTTELVQ